ncbi:hypothetical protein DT075_05890 [Bacillus licheniformis]|nr:hypothetical protein DT075_05890 [Bacillus licheniformis]
MRKYEIMYIIRPDVDEESKKAVVERFNNILTTNGAEITETKDSTRIYPCGNGRLRRSA